MLQRDFILRQLEAFAKALGEVIFRRKDGQLDEALRMLNDTVRQDGEMQAIRELPLAEFIRRVDFMEDMDPRKWAMLAEMLNEEANILDEMGKSEVAHSQRSKAFHLALEVTLTDPETYRPALLSIVEAAAICAEAVGLHPATLELLKEYRSLEN